MLALLTNDFGLLAGVVGFCGWNCVAGTRGRRVVIGPRERESGGASNCRGFPRVHSSNQDGAVATARELDSTDEPGAVSD